MPNETHTEKKPQQSEDKYPRVVTVYFKDSAIELLGLGCPASLSTQSELGKKIQLRMRIAPSWSGVLARYKLKDETTSTFFPMGHLRNAVLDSTWEW